MAGLLVFLGGHRTSFSALTGPRQSGKRPGLRKTHTHAGSITLVKSDLGIKRVCPSCGVRFYDLQKRPIECPKCAFSFEPESLYKQRRPRQPEAVVAAPVADREEEDEEEEAEETEEEEAEATTVVDAVEGEAPLEIATDDEEEEEVAEPEPEDAGMSVVDAEGEDIEAIEGDDEGGDEEEDAGLLEEEEDEGDVSGINPDIAKDER
jgi:uncharacterized protein (TIGR02300 family)